jgi:osmotically-inducible protein OsmY
MNRHQASGSVVLAVVFAFAGPLALLSAADGPGAPSSQVTSTPSSPTMASAIVQALQANPVTAPYRFTVSQRGTKYALAGRVGTKQVHDAAIQTMIGLGYPVRDDLTIDTAEVYRVAAQSAATLPPTAQTIPYIYPPPLMGRLDDPFYGLEPPLLSYPPWFRAVASREPINYAAINAAQAPVSDASTIPPGSVEMTLDTQGVATLRGQVPTMGDRIGLGQQVARMKGIAQVVNLLEVNPALLQSSDVPPPPPTPAPPRPGAAQRPPAAPRPLPAPAAGVVNAPVAVSGDALAGRVADVIAHRPALASVPVKVSARDGIVSLTGRVSSAYEAMLAYRAAERTPGVRSVVDRLEFPLPEADAPNSLRDKGRPEDVEPYLLAQIRRQVGDLAHVDAVKVRGDTLEVRGSVTRTDDTERVEATLRSIPLLRGFRLEPTFAVE